MHKSFICIKLILFILFSSTIILCTFIIRPLILRQVSLGCKLTPQSALARFSASEIYSLPQHRRQGQKVYRERKYCGLVLTNPSLTSTRHFEKLLCCCTEVIFAVSRRIHDRDEEQSFPSSLRYLFQDPNEYLVQIIHKIFLHLRQPGLNVVG